MKKFLTCLFIIIFAITFVSCASSETPDTSEESDSIAEDTQSDTNDKLVAYFSATGNTKKVAEMISEDTNATLFEIEPTNAYTEEDLDYNTENSRTETENNDPSARPEIKNKVDDMDKYSIIFLGYPIWYGEAPKIISTFLESYNFSGKTIIPFCTSSSSGIGESADNLEGLAPGADWLDGMRFSSSATQEEVQEFISGLNLKE